MPNFPNVTLGLVYNENIFKHFKEIVNFFSRLPFQTIHEALMLTLTSHLSYKRMKCPPVGMQKAYHAAEIQLVIQGLFLSFHFLYWVHFFSII